MRILAVDDKAMPRRVLEQAIREADPAAELTVCSSGAQVLGLPDPGSFAVAFLDVDMPGMGGVELARRLKRLNPRVNIVFATGYDDYMADAFALRSSGYLLKPITAEKVAAELDNLRFRSAPQRSGGLYMRCFGDFEAFYGRRALEFGRTKSRELLAFLVDRRGAVVSMGEAEAALWEGREHGAASSSYLRTLVTDLRRTLAAVGCEDVLVRGYGRLGVNIDGFECDYYDYLRGDPLAINDWRGEYMSQYAWAETTKAALVQGAIE